MKTNDAPGKTQKEIVLEAYGAIAEGGPAARCGPGPDKESALGVGYSTHDVECLPDDALLGLSCGNPVAEAGLQEGEVVLDLGSGGGHDAILASRQVGPRGKVIGVDMTPAMIERASKTAEEMGLEGAEFRLGEIEALPVDDACVDVVLSNCSINLSPDKPSVFREVQRVLKPGGRMVISDIVLTGELPEQVRTSPEALVACIAGAVTMEEYLEMIRAAGLELESVVTEQSHPALEPDSSDPVVRAVYDAVPDPESLDGIAVSVAIFARKPEEEGS